jgi:argininosuccinate synthase
MTQAIDGGGMRRERIILGFTGDLETTVAVRWLAETFGVDVVALIADFGQAREIEEIRDRALALGALRAHVLDVREEFARAYLLPALKAGVLGDRARAPAAALRQAAVAAKLVEIAGIEQANRVAHGGVSAAGRIAAAVHALKPDCRVVAPACDWSMTRDALLVYARERRLRLPVAVVEASTPSPVSGMHGVRTFGSASFGTPQGPHYRASASTAGMSPQPADAAVVDITFNAGLPVALNGVAMPLLDLIGSLDFLAGKNGVGGHDRFETPSVTVLAAAHEQLRQTVAAGELTDFSQTVTNRYADLVEQGRWFSVLRAALDAYVDRAEQMVNGMVRVRLYEGVYDIVGSHIADRQTNNDNAVVGALRHRA